ncbi:MAG: DUF4260 domain-containing protein [Flavobacteriales bacterium]
MKNLLRLEEAAQFSACLACLIIGDVAWWWYVLLLLGPDIGMLGYLINARVGAVCYNLLHHKLVAMAVLLLSIQFGYIGADGDPKVHLLLFDIGLVLYGHASMDRIFGYGLKYGDAFKHTHLGWIGGKSEGEVARGKG